MAPWARTKLVADERQAVAANHADARLEAVRLLPAGELPLEVVDARNVGCVITGVHVQNIGRELQQQRPLRRP